MSDDRWERDEETWADVNAREATVHDRTRVAAGPRRLDPDIVAHWPCRHCRTPTPLPEMAADVFAMCSANLRHRGEMPLDTSTILVCDACTPRHREEQARRDEVRWERERDAVNRLRDACSPDQEREAMLELQRLGMRKHAVDELAREMRGVKLKAEAKRPARGRLT